MAIIHTTLDSAYRAAIEHIDNHADASIILAQRAGQREFRIFDMLNRSTPSDLFTTGPWVVILEAYILPDTEPRYVKLKFVAQNTTGLIPLPMFKNTYTLSEATK